MPNSVKQVLGDKADLIAKQISAWNAKAGVSTRLATSSKDTGTPSRVDPARGGNRTLCRPDFRGEGPLDCLRLVEPSQLALSAFDSEKV